MDQALQRAGVHLQGDTVTYSWDQDRAHVLHAVEPRGTMPVASFALEVNGSYRWPAIDVQFSSTDPNCLS